MINGGEPRRWVVQVGCSLGFRNVRIILVLGVHIELTQLVTGETTCDCKGYIYVWGIGVATERGKAVGTVRVRERERGAIEKRRPGAV